MVVEYFCVVFNIGIYLYSIIPSSNTLFFIAKDCAFNQAEQDLRVGNYGCIFYFFESKKNGKPFQIYHSFFRIISALRR